MPRHPDNYTHNSWNHTSDGKVAFTVRRAIEHNNQVRIRKWINHYNSMCKHGSNDAHFYNLQRRILLLDLVGYMKW